MAFIFFLAYQIAEITTQSTPGCFNTSTRLQYSVLITLFSWSGPSISYDPQGYHHTFNFRVAQSDYQENYFSLSYYRIDIQNTSLSYEASLENVTSTGAVMYFNPSTHSSIVSIQFFITLKQPCTGEIFMTSISIMDYIKITNRRLIIQQVPLSIKRQKFMWINPLEMTQTDMLLRFICLRLSLIRRLGPIIKFTLF